MTPDFFSDPENAMVLQICRTSPGFVPVVVGGHLHPVREVNVEAYPVSANSQTEDLVLGLEVLGCRVERSADGFVVREPAAFRSATWKARARSLRSIVEGERKVDVADHLGARAAG